MNHQKSSRAAGETAHQDGVLSSTICTRCGELPPFPMPPNYQSSTQRALNGNTQRFQTYLPSTTASFITSTATMGAGSKVALVCLRIWELVCSVIVLGILGSFLHRLSDAGVSRDGRVIYGIVTASISTAFSIVFIAPFLYAFLAFPADFVLWIMWLIVFCLLITVRTCSR